MSDSPELRRLVGSLLPPSVLAWVRRRRGVRWSGDYSRWADARKASAGYDSPAILRKVAEATRSVRDGRAAAERDSVVFEDIPANPALESALEIAAAKGRGEVTVLDFGGALGSNYWPRRKWLRQWPGARWVVVEQDEYVTLGRAEFQNEQLRFYRSLEECYAGESPTIVLLSSVLPYLENPHAVLTEIVRRGPPLIMVDRTGFTARGTDQLTIQQVPPSIYAASYPCWFLGRQGFLAHFAAGYELREEHDNAEDAGPGLHFKGFLFGRASRLQPAGEIATDQPG